jgi:hypothetical protein
VLLRLLLGTLKFPRLGRCERPPPQEIKISQRSDYESFCTKIEIIIYKSFQSQAVQPKLKKLFSCLLHIECSNNNIVGTHDALNRPANHYSLIYSTLVRSLHTYKPPLVFSSFHLRPWIALYLNAENEKKIMQVSLLCRSERQRPRKTTNNE